MNGSALRSVAAVLMLALAAVSHSHVDAIRVTDDRGRVFEATTSPLRIVSLLPSLTESVCALGACARLVGTDDFSNWPSTVAALPKLGGLEDATVEGIAALHPDVVLAGTTSRIIERLEELGIPVVALEAQSLHDTRRVLNNLASLLGDSALADRVWQHLEAQLAAASSEVPGQFRGSSVYFEVAEAPYAAGAASFIGELLSTLGLINIVPAQLGAFPRLNPEYVIRAQPDLIMASQRDLSDMQGRPGWNALRALHRKRSCGFASGDVDMMVRPGPRLGEAAELMARCLVRVAGAH